MDKGYVCAKGIVTLLSQQTFIIEASVTFVIVTMYLYTIPLPTWTHSQREP